LVSMGRKTRGNMEKGRRRLRGAAGVREGVKKRQDTVQKRGGNTYPPGKKNQRGEQEETR